VVIEGPAAICFSSIGRIVPNTAPGPTDAECKLPTDRPYYEYVIKMSESTAADRTLHVTVALGGQVRMCDPLRTLSATQPDGCPAP
jgi:type IV fimbrial biogenesis protein FimT